MSKTLTYIELQASKACDHDLNLFKQTFGEEVLLTKETAIQAVEAGLNLDWFILYVLTPAQRKKYRIQFNSIESTYQHKLAEFAILQDTKGTMELTHQRNLNKAELLAQIINEE